MNIKLLNTVTDIINILFGSKKRYTIQTAHYSYSKLIQIQITNDENNKIIYNNSIKGDYNDYLKLCNELRNLCMCCEALYSKLDIYNLKNITYNKQTIYLQNIKIIININPDNYKESIAAAEYHKKINYPKNNAKNYSKIKTTLTRNLVG